MGSSLDGPPEEFSRMIPVVWSDHDHFGKCFVFLVGSTGDSFGIKEVDPPELEQMMQRAREYIREHAQPLPAGNKPLP